jgi:hypothetical protein
MKHIEPYNLFIKESINYSDFFKVIKDEYYDIEEIPKREKDTFEEYEKEKILDCLAGWSTTYNGKTRMTFSISSPVVNDTQKVFGITIMKKKDEWFNVILIRGFKKLNTNNLYAPLTSHENTNNYACDQIDGLIVCLEYIKKEYIYSPI